MLRDIQPEDLRETGSLLSLYDQAVEQRLVSASEGGRFDFLALAERARARGRNPGGLFKWLLVNGRFDYITQADEDAAQARLRAYRNRDWSDPAAGNAGQGRGPASPPPRELTPQDKIVERCMIAAKHLSARRRQEVDPFLVAREGFQWSRDQWERAKFEYECRQRERWVAVGERMSQE
mgnify:CR=1 FL=1